MRIILPRAPEAMIASWALAASARGNSLLMRGTRAPCSRPVSMVWAMLLSSSGVALNIDMPRMEVLRAIVSRGSISMGPRLPITTTRPRLESTFKSLARFTLASISRIKSTPRC